MTKADILFFTAQFIQVFARIMVFAIMARVIMSWISVGKSFSSKGRFTQILNDVTDPVLNLAKKIPHRIGMIDLSPLIALFGIDILSQLLVILILKLV